MTVCFFIHEFLLVCVFSCYSVLNWSLKLKQLRYIFRENFLKYVPYMSQIFQGGEKPKSVSHFKHYSMSCYTFIKHQSVRTK